MKKLIKFFSLVLVTSMLFSCATPAGDDNNGGNGGNNGGNSNPPTLLNTELGDLSKYGIKTYADSEKDVIDAIKEIVQFISGNTNGGSRAVNTSAKQQYTKFFDDINAFIPKGRQYYQDLINKGELPNEDINFNEEINVSSISFLDAIDTFEDFGITFCNAINRDYTTSPFAEIPYSKIKYTISPFNENISLSDFLLKANLNYSASNLTLDYGMNDKIKFVFNNIRDVNENSPLVGAAVSAAYDFNWGVSINKILESMNSNTPDYTKVVDECITSYTLKTNQTILLAVVTSNKMGGFFEFTFSIDIPKSTLAKILESTVDDKTLTNEQRNAKNEELQNAIGDCMSLSVNVKDDAGAIKFTTTWSLSEIQDLVNSLS